MVRPCGAVAAVISCICCICVQCRDNDEDRVVIQEVDYGEPLPSEFNVIDIIIDPQNAFLSMHILEMAIGRLREQYEFLKRAQAVSAIVEQGYASLYTEDEKLRAYRTEYQPTLVQLKSMKGRLKLIENNFRLAWLRVKSGQVS